MENKDIFIVASYNSTLPGKLITTRAALKFWNRYDGDMYSHISLSRDPILDNMISFARKEMHNIFKAGLVREDIRTGLFKKHEDSSKIAVMKLSISEEIDNILSKVIDDYWNRKDELYYNYLGLFKMLFLGRGTTTENHYFCTQWVVQVLRESGIDILNGMNAYDIRPFDIYGELRDNIIYEGLTKEYPEYNKKRIKR